MYTANLGHLFDLFEKDLPTWKTTTTLRNDAVGYTTQTDDSYEIAFNVIGHSKENISIDVEENILKIKATPSEDVSSVIKNLVSSIDHTIRISSSYDVSKTSAEVENGILLISIPKKEEAKQKKISVKVK